MPTATPQSPSTSGAEHAPECVDALLATSRALVGVAARSLADVERDLTLVQFRALVLLGTRGPRRAGELGQELGVRPATVTGLCDRLELKDLVRRVSAPGSRREVVVELTPAGDRLLRAVMRRRRRELERTCAKMSAAQQRAVADALAIYAEAAGEMPDDAWKMGWAP